MSNKSIEFVDLVSEESNSDVTSIDVELKYYEETTEDDSGQTEVVNNLNQSTPNDANSDSTEIDNSQTSFEELVSCNGTEDTEGAVDSDELMDTSLDEPETDFANKKKSQLKATFAGGVIGDKQALWSIQFNSHLPDGHNYFAAAGGDRVTVYECLDDPTKPIRLVDCFADTNYLKDKPRRRENYYTVCWSFDDTSGNPLIICGGVRSIIRVIDCGAKTDRYMTGHGGAINDLKTSPHEHNLILSSSEDHSIRLWNLKTFVCVARFWGESGHRDQVISSDFYLLSDKYFVSAGMDHSINIWSFDSKDLRQAVKESYEPLTDNKHFPMRNIFYPVFTNRDVHNHYIDCVQFLGKWVLSKALSNKIVMVKPDFLDEDRRQVGHRAINKDISGSIAPDITYCGALRMHDNEFWFVKFSMDFEQSLLAIGNSKGTTYLWDMAVDDPTEYQPLLLKNRRSRKCIRQTGFNSDGTILICVSENSSIFRWNITRPSPP